MTEPITTEQIKGMRPSDIFQALARRSLKHFLEFCTIDSRPVAKRFKEAAEPWQWDVYGPIIPAMEYICGIRERHEGKLLFWRTLPKSSDKSSMMARLCSGILQFGKRPLGICVAAADQEQARLVRDAMLAEQRLNRHWFLPEKQFKIDNLKAHGPGGELQILASDAASAQGQRAQIYIADEITHWKSRRLWDMINGSLMKYSDTVCIVCTNAGYLHTWQDELIEECKKSDLWDVYEAPGILASWVSKEKIAELRKTMLPGEAQRLIDNIWVLGSGKSVFSAELIEQIWATHRFKPLELPDIEYYINHVHK